MDWIREFWFPVVLNEFDVLIQNQEVIPENLLRRLSWAWGNPAWSGKPDFLLATIEAAKAAQVVLECGSGLSTILVGIVLEYTGGRLFSLEHSPEWGERVREVLHRHYIHTAAIVPAPLVEFDGFDWYSLRHLPQELEFDLVVCDGPPGETTRGGRYGLVPCTINRLSPDCTIILDDIDRKAERDIIGKWEQEYGFIIEERTKFGLLTRPIPAFLLH